MSLKSAQQMAEMYQTAIQSLVGGGISSYSVGGRSFTLNNLGQLEDLYRYWSSKAAETRGGFVTYADMRQQRNDGGDL